MVTLTVSFETAENILNSAMVIGVQDIVEIIRMSND